MKRAGVVMILNGIIWGIVVIACSLALKDTGGFKEIQHILGGGATSSLLLLVAGTRKKRQD